MVKKKTKSPKRGQLGGSNKYREDRPITNGPHEYRLASHIWLGIIAFWAGFAVMVVELVGNRILAPWFGNSLYTWTGLIGVILIALSSGYYFGGWLADKKPDFLVLSHLLAVSAVLVSAIPLLHALLEESFPKAGMISGPVFASGLLFALPGFTLGSVSPFAVRLICLLSDDARIGISAGRVGMLGTLGSVLGTFMAGFILIPKMKLSTIFIFITVVLGCLSMAGYFFTLSGLKSKAITLSVLSIGIIVIASLSQLLMPQRPSELIYEKTTFYHRIRVFQQQHANGDRLKRLYLDSTSEGAQFEISKEIPIVYQRYWELAKLFCPGLKRAAFIGGGSYTMPEALSDHYPHAKVDVIEIDPEVEKVGIKFFKLSEYPNIHSAVGDARQYLYQTSESYDLIFGDAYNGVRNIPAHLVTLEFFNLVKSRLNNQGVFMMNIISSVNGDKSVLFNSIVKTLGESFKSIYVFAAHAPFLDAPQNVMIVASDQKVNFMPGSSPGRYNASLRQLVMTFVPEYEYDASNAPLLTDEFNPVEYMVAKSLS